MTTLQLLSLLVATAALFGWVSTRWLRLPLTIGTMLLTVGLSLALEALGTIFPSMHPWALRLVLQIDFPHLILDGMLPLLLFAGAFLLDLESLFEQRLIVASLAIGGTLLSTAAVASLMFGLLTWLGVAPQWLPCLLFGALISPTDPIAVLEMLRRVGVSPSLQAQLAGESLFNDGVGAVIFITLLGMAHGAVPSVARLVGTLTWQIGGALLLAVSAAWLVSWLMSQVDAYQVEILLSLALAFGGYATAEALHLSAPLEAVFAALALRRFNAQRPRERISHETIDRFWEVIDEVQNAVLFVLLGLEALAISVTRSSLAAGTLAVITVLSVRVATVAVIFLVLRLCRYRHRSSVAVLGWGGLHGGLSLALALSIPRALTGSWLLPSTYMVVLFSVVVQGGSMPLLLRRFRAETAPEGSPLPTP